MSTVKGIDIVVKGLGKIERKSIDFLSNVVDAGSLMVSNKAKRNLTKPGGSGPGGKHIVTAVLQNSIEPIGAELTAGAIEGGVAANTEYAALEEARHPFLHPAMTEEAGKVKRLLERALKKAGF